MFKVKYTKQAASCRVDKCNASTRRVDHIRCLVDALSLIHPTCFFLLTCLFATSCFAGPGAHGPNGEHLDAPATSNTSALARLPDGSVNVTKAAQRRMAIRTQLSVASQAAMTVALPAKIVADPNASGRVQTIHGGRVEVAAQALPIAGQTVRKGQLLAYVRHHAEPYSQAAQQSVLTDLRGQRQLAEQQLQRLKQLEGSVPSKEIAAAEINLNSLSQREQQTAQSLQAREALIAPVAGVIARADLVAGQVVEPRDVLFEITDPNRMLLEANTADPSLPHKIEQANLLNYEQIKLSQIGAARSLRDGMLPIIFSVVGKQTELALGQPVTVLVQLKQRVQGFVLPAQAVVRNPANESVVWIKSGAERFIPQPVQFMPLNATQVVITQGLSADNRVVIAGASLIAQIR